jgi:hypothetical protein
MNQEENLKKAFQKLAHKPKAELSDNIWDQIVVREKRLIRIKLYIFSLAGFLAMAGLVPAFKALFAEFTQSGFYEYFSLVFSSGGNLFSYWKDLALSLVESLPILNIIFSFSLIFVFLLSVRYVLKQIINNSYIGKTYARI